MPTLVQPLPAGPLDIIGDIHGEIDALESLLGHLGVDLARGRARRPLVFVGDLVDRGPDSVAVVRLVRRFVEAGQAWCVAGNHELNLLLGLVKEGNGWARGDAADSFQLRGPTGVEHRPFGSRMASHAEREDLLNFFRTLPLALVREDLRVVHACWHASSVAALPQRADLAALTREWSRRITQQLREEGVLAAERVEREAFAELKRLDLRPTRPLPAHTRAAGARQSSHPVKVLTSGLERPLPFDDIFFVGGKWRFVRRDDWWTRYDDGPAVVVGHYWRRRAGARVPGKPDTWQTVGFADWTGPRGNVFCVDYSVGRRFRERDQRGPGAFEGALAALRWPERTLVFDDDPVPVPTTNWGGRD